MTTTAPARSDRRRAAADDDLGIIDALVQLSFIVQGTLARHAAAYDLSMIQIRLLGVLRDRRPTMHELARLLELDKSSATGLVNRAERRGLVQRTPSTTDRRVIHVELTAKGRRIVTDGVKEFESEMTSLTACVRAQDRQRLSILATRLVRECAGR
jgi:DNA-binding MarR family transcriptional regulator